MEQVVVVGLDMAKSVFQVHGVDRDGGVHGPAAAGRNARAHRPWRSRAARSAGIGRGAESPAPQGFPLSPRYRTHARREADVGSARWSRGWAAQQRGKRGCELGPQET